MALDHSEIIALLKEMYLFSGFDEAALNRASLLFTQMEYPDGTILMTAGKYSDGFYIIAEGEVLLTYQERANNDLLDVLVPGDFFGDVSLLTGGPNVATATTAGQVILLKAEPFQFNELLVQFPDIKINLVRIVQSIEMIRTNRFDWLNEDEVVYQVRRKHEAFLLITLLWPAVAVLIVLLMALGGLFLLPPNTTLQTVFMILMAVLFLGGLLWAVWNWIDWSNDFYVITSQRVVWIEHVIGLYESRVEAPHSTIQAVNVFTSLIGRFLGYGNVIVSTFTGKVVLYQVGEPHQMSALIEEHWHRATRNYQKTEKEELERSIRRITNAEEPASTAPQVRAAPMVPLDDYQEPDFTRSYLSGFFEMRFQEGSTITYRKHWIILLRRAWKPTLTILLLVGGMLACAVTYYTQYIMLVNPVWVAAVGILLLVFVIFPWWLYNYVDWRNDIYQLTDKNLFDIERKPLGTESRKSASLERILSLEHERPGFIGYILNVGNVEINFGDTKLTFDGVYDPARVQQEIFTRMHQLRLQKQKEEVSRERDAILSLLETYHRIANGEND